MSRIPVPSVRKVVASDGWRWENGSRQITLLLAAQKMAESCIYCGRCDSFCEAHILPESLGKFKDQPKQKELVCAECDREIGKAEEQLARCGVEAVLRTHLNIKGKRKHKPSSPFRRRHAGQGPIELKATFPGTDYEVYVEPLGDGGNMTPLPQLLLSNSNGEHDSIKLPDPMSTTAEYLRNALHKSPLKGDLRVETLGLTNEEVEHVFGVLRGMGVLTDEEHTPTDEACLWERHYPDVRVHGPIVVDARYFRALAKIGFHYFIEFAEYFSGREDCFAPVREFIRYGRGSIEEFVSQQRGNLVSELNLGFRPSYYGHFIIGDFTNNAANAYVQLFIGRDINPPYCRIPLARNCLHIHLDNCTFGHFYNYYPPDKRSQYTGEIQRLGATQRIQMPKRFRVNVPRR